MLNPEIAKAVLRDIIMQLQYRYASNSATANVVKNLSNMGSVKSWGQLAQDAAKIAKPLGGATKDIALHVGTRARAYNLDPEGVKNILPPEYLTGPAAAWAAIKAGLLTNMPVAVSYGGPLATGAVGAYKINSTKNKLNKEIDKNIKETGATEDAFQKLLKSRRPKKEGPYQSQGYSEDTSQKPYKLSNPYQSN